MSKDELYNKLEEHIINVLQKDHSAITENLYENILLKFRMLDLNTNLLIFLYNRDILVPCILNIIHYFHVKHYKFSTQNKVLDLRILFDFKSKEKYFSEKYWIKINKSLQKAIKYKRYEQPRS